MKNEPKLCFLVTGALLFAIGTMFMFWDGWLGKLLPDKLKIFEDRIASIGIASLVVGTGLIMFSLY